MKITSKFIYLLRQYIEFYDLIEYRGKYKITQQINFIFPHSGYNLNMSPFYTRKGDDGSTGQLGEGRLPKNHPRIEALGTLDEVSAALGLARALCQSPETKPILIEIQRDLYTLMAGISATPENVEIFKTLDMPRVQWLESQVDNLSTQLPLTAEFILPGDSLSGAALALSRTIVRRAERRVVELYNAGEIQNPYILQYLNRLSSLCFALELLENQNTGHKTTLAKK
jgi:cob(I)alamin adenosyltransferase